MQVSYFIASLFGLVALAAVTAEAQTIVPPFDATAFCFHCLTRLNQKDHYPYPNDCHFFVQCLYVNETFALGIVRPCAPGFFWNDAILQCVPEGSTPCIDQCQNDVIAARGCYADPTNCVNYYVCANQQSHAFCCPAGTRFDENSCSCLEDETCTDTCPARPQPNPTTPLPDAEQVGGSCRDAFGNILTPVAGRPDLFQLDDSILACAPGTQFNLTSCRCDVVVELNPPQQNNKACYLWLPFETDTEDKSIFKFRTDLLGSAALDTSAGADPHANGQASLAINGGRLEVPGLKTIDLSANGASASWCLWFRCGGPGNACTSSGGLLSNNADSSLTDYSIIMAAQPGNQAAYRLQFSAPVFSATATAAVRNGWNQFCVVYDSETATTSMWINNVVASTQPGAGNVRISHCPYTVGDDQFYGNFNGNIDDVLVCPNALTNEEINAHFTGDFAFLRAQGLF